MSVGGYQSQPKQSGKGIIIVSGILLGIALFFGVFGLAARFSLLNAGFFQRIFEKQQIYQQLPSAIASSLSSSLSQDNTSSNILRYLPQEQLTTLLEAAIPQDWIKNQTNYLLQQLFAYLNLQSEQLTFSFDMSEVKSAFESKSGEIAGNILASLPKCTIQDLAKLTVAATTNNFSNAPMCNPPDPIRKLVTPVLANSVASLGKSIPANIQVPGVNTAPNSGLTRLFHAYRVIREIFTFTLIGATILGFFLLIISFTTSRYALKTLGMSSLIPGIMTGLIGLVIMASTTILINSARISTAGNGFLQSMVFSATKGIVTGYGQTVTLCGLACTGVGIICLLVYRLVRQS